MSNKWFAIREDDNELLQRLKQEFLEADRRHNEAIAVEAKARLELERTLDRLDSEAVGGGLIKEGDKLGWSIERMEDGVDRVEVAIYGKSALERLFNDK